MRWLFGHWMPYESVYSTGSETRVDLDRMHGRPYTDNEEMSHGHQFVYIYTHYLNHYSFETCLTSL